MTRVVRFHQTGGPEVMQIDDITIGEPKAGEMRVRIEAIGLNRAEAMFRAGGYMHPANLPSTNGYEASAIVDKVGPGVSGFTVGEPISVIPALHLSEYGVYADVAIVPAHACVKRPPGLTAVEAAAVWMAYLTTWGALVDIANVQRGDAVIITAASSSVGISAIQMVNYLGGVSIAATRTRAKADELTRQGAQHVVVTDEEDLVERVKAITGGSGARVVYDPAGGPMLIKLAEAAAAKGIIIEYGALSPEPTPYPLFASMIKGLTIRGYTLFEFMPDRAKIEKGADFIYKGFSEKAFKPIVSKVFELADIVEAHRYLESNAQLGKIVVTAKG